MRSGVAPLLGFGAAIVVASEFIIVGLVPAMTVDLEITPSEAGLLVTLFALASALLGPILVAATARASTASVLAGSLLPFAASLLLLILPNYAVVASLRVLQGAALPVFMSVAGAQLAAMQGPGRGIALLYVGVTIGSTFAPPLGNIAGEQMGWEAPMAAMGALALAGVFGCFIVSDGDEPVVKRGGSWRLLLRQSVPAHLLLSTLLFATMFAGFSYIALLLDRAGLAGNSITIALLAFGAAGLAGNALAGRFASWSVRATHLVAFIVAGATASLSAGIGLRGSEIIIIIMLIWGMAHAAGFVFCQVRVMALAPEAPSFAGALNISAANIGIAMGSFLGGHAIERGDLIGLGPLALGLALTSAGVAHWIIVRERLRCKRGRKAPNSSSSRASATDPK